MTYTVIITEYLAKEITAGKTNVQEAKELLDQKIREEKIVLDAEDYIGREITLAGEEIPFPDVSTLANHTSETERSFIVIETLQKTMVIDADNEETAKEVAGKAITDCDIILSADDYTGREIVFQESDVDKSLKDLLKNGLGGKPLEDRLKVPLYGVTELFEHMYGKQFTTSKYYENDIRHYYQDSLRDAAEVKLKQDGLIPVSRFNISAKWKNSLNDHWEAEAMCKILNREYSRDVLAVRDKDDLSISVYTLDPQKQQDIKNMVRKSWALEKMEIKEFRDMEYADKYILELGNGQNIIGFINPSTNETREQMNNYRLILNDADGSCRWKMIKNEKGTDCEYNVLLTYSKVKFPEYGEVNIRSYTPANRKNSDLLRASNINVFRLPEGGYAIRCSVDGEALCAEHLSRTDNAVYKKISSHCTEVEKIELNRFYANKYFAETIRNNRENEQGFSLKR